MTVFTTRTPDSRYPRFMGWSALNPYAAGSAIAIAIVAVAARWGSGGERERGVYSPVELLYQDLTLGVPN
ncbi:hypothetical protein M0802_008470 [Mischocyttarus mexicanus]|nr:hypothetical protein M0802_008470 [Mischocyttarus mexicanus]